MPDPTIRGVLLDIAGVVHDGGTPAPGAAEAIARLRAASLPLRFLTNSTRNPKARTVAQLVSMGLEVAPADILTPAAVACDRLIADGLRPHLLIHPDLQEDFARCPTDGPPALVLGDAREHFTYDNLNAALRVLAQGAPFLALAANRVFRGADGQLNLDAGAFVRALEYGSGITAQVLGKPAPSYFHAGAAQMGLPPDQVAMVGDDAESDVAGALNAGLGMAILVRTGKYRPGDDTAYAPAPSAVAADLTRAVDLILS